MRRGDFNTNKNRHLERAPLTIGACPENERHKFARQGLKDISVTPFGVGIKAALRAWLHPAGRGAVSPDDRTCCKYLAMALLVMLTAMSAAAQQAEFYQEPDTISVSAPAKLDLNSATVEQIKSLEGLPEKVAENIHQYRFRKGKFTSFYHLMEVEGMTPEILRKLAPQVSLIPPPERSLVTRYIADLQDKLASEESPGKGAIDAWESLLLRPMDINKASVDDLLILDNVTAVDAAAVVRHIKLQGEIKDWRTLSRNVYGLSHYGFLNMRNYVAVAPQDRPFRIDGNYRLKASWDDRLDSGDETDLRHLAALMQASIKAFSPGAASYDTMTTAKILSQAGWTDPQILDLKNRLMAEKAYLDGLRNYGSYQHRLVMNLGDNLRLGGLWHQEAYETEHLAKGYAQLSDIGPLRKLVLGNYRVVIGQGLVMDNTDDDFYGSRRTSRAAGLFGDITTTQEFALRGAALELGWGRIRPTLFYSDDRKDGILNRDGTVSGYMVFTPRFPYYRDVFGEKTTGFSLAFNLDEFLFLPVGTSLGLSGYQAKYDRTFKPSAQDLDIPGDKDKLSDPNFTQLWSGERRRIGGLFFRTVLDNLSVEGEMASQQNGGKAYLLSSRLQYETVYLLLIQRRYDVDYDNPYSRAFQEQVKFDDTVLEKEYRLLDPIYKQLVNYPAPKAEQGTYLETRWQISRQFTLTRAYIDLWRNLAYGLNNVRFQGEIEYRPVFPLRIRLKQKYQTKHLPKSAWPTRSNTRETTLRSFATLTQQDYLNIELRYGEVRLTPSELYNGDLLMCGSYVAGNLEHNFSPTWDLKLGLAAWRTDGMSQWIFEESGIDFLYSQGLKYYVSVSDRLSDNLQVRLGLRGKDTRYFYTGVYGPDSKYYYAGLPAVPVKDFLDSRDLWHLEMQLDLRW